MGGVKGSFASVAQGSVMVLATTVIALLAVSQALAWGWEWHICCTWEGCEDILRDGGC